MTTNILFLSRSSHSIVRYAFVYIMRLTGHTYQSQYVNKAIPDDRVARSKFSHQCCQPHQFEIEEHRHLPFKMMQWDTGIQYTPVSLAPMGEQTNIKTLNWFNDFCCMAASKHTHMRQQQYPEGLNSRRESVHWACNILMENAKLCGERRPRPHVNGCYSCISLHSVLYW